MHTNTIAPTIYFDEYKRICWHAFGLKHSVFSWNYWQRNNCNFFHKVTLRLQLPRYFTYVIFVALKDFFEPMFFWGIGKKKSQKKFPGWITIYGLEGGWIIHKNLPCLNVFRNEFSLECQRLSSLLCDCIDLSLTFHSLSKCIKTFIFQLGWHLK